METKLSTISSCLRVVLLLTLSITVSSKIVSTEECPPWFVYDNATRHCQCYHGNHLGKDIHCNENGVLIEVGNCMTYERNVGTYFAKCYYFELPHSNVTPNGFFHLPNNVSDLNYYMCGHMNRKGLVCSECIDDFGPSVTSFGYKCANCSNSWSGVTLYIIVEFVPITVFYLLILTFRINMTSAPMTCFILYSQVMVYGIFKDPITINKIITQSHNSCVAYPVMFAGIFYGFWNLDFLKYVVPPLCISSKLNIIHIEFLSCLSALYSLCLVILTWICVELHGRNFRPLVIIWKPLHGCFVRLRKGYNPNNDIIDVFSTFLLLTYSKLNFQLVQIFSSQYIIRNGLPYAKVNLYDPSIIYMSNKHFPYMTVSVFILTVLVIPPPFILLLYPTKMFNTVLTKFKVNGRSKIVLQTFVEKFYRCYNNGLNGTKDTRSFSAIYFFLRPVVIVIYEIRVLHLFYNEWFLAVTLFVCISVLVSYVKPYRKSYMNILDTLLLLHIALLSLLSSSSFKKSTRFIAISEILLFTAPMVIFLLIFTMKYAFKFKDFLLSKNCSYQNAHVKEAETCIQGSLADGATCEERQHLLPPTTNVKSTSYT